MVLATVTTHDYELHQMDVATILLHGDIEKDVFIHHATGIRDPSSPQLVCMLSKAIYGQKQALRMLDAN